MNRQMRSYQPILVGALVLVALMVSAVVSQNESDELVTRGKYLVTTAGCGDCHSPKKMTEQGPVEDEARLLSGHPVDEPIPALPEGVLGMGPDKWAAMANVHLTAWAGPWGVSFASNLTSDKKTGMGNWTDEQFIKAMRSGKHRGFGRQILPPMPWFNLARMTDDDLKAILAYLHSVPAVKNEVPAPIPPAGK